MLRYLLLLLSISSCHNIDKEEDRQALEDSLSNEYGNLLIAQQVDQFILYIFFRVKNGKKVFTMVTVNPGTMEIRRIQQSSKINFALNRYSPTYKYTQPIYSTNHKYLMRKFFSSIYLSEEIMDNLVSLYLRSEEKATFKQLNLFTWNQSILKILQKK